MLALRALLDFLQHIYIAIRDLPGKGGISHKRYFCEMPPFHGDVTRRKAARMYVHSKNIFVTWTYLLTFEMRHNNKGGCQSSTLFCEDHDTKVSPHRDGAIISSMLSSTYRIIYQC